ncbi:GNAT family N-acetyltransferase [Streptomyces naphthomycinicus]|uniref:GNAT family N-acetyltransferase n=1 Tax=Streptomyces naphthomycinicus TaxID=2872625 RepID=UPI0027E44444|nr:GNAT family N-acetyltransferase [Streptomyces sp. TML10]
MTPVLRTERLEFLPYRPEHEDVFVALLRDEEVCRWMGQDLVPEPQIRELFRAILTDVYPRRRFDVWGLWLAGRYIGHAEVKPTGNVDGHELVTALAPGYWGRGLGGEAVRGLLRHAADGLGLTEAYGMVGAENTASLAMCRRLGFRHVRDVVDEDGHVTKLLVIPTGLGTREPAAASLAETTAPAAPSAEPPSAEPPSAESPSIESPAPEPPAPEGPPMATPASALPQPTAAPDPAVPHPAAPDPAAPDRAVPHLAAPDPAAPDPAARDSVRSVVVEGPGVTTPAGGGPAVATAVEDSV